MFDIGWTEMLLCAVVAVLVLGPKDIPQLVKASLEFAVKLRRMAGLFQDNIDKFMKDHDLDDLQRDWHNARYMRPGDVLPLDDKPPSLEEIEALEDIEIASDAAQPQPQPQQGIK